MVYVRPPDFLPFPRPRVGEGEIAENMDTLIGTMGRVARGHVER